MDEVVSHVETATEDFNALLMSIFGCTAILLAAIGVYGLMAYSVCRNEPRKSASAWRWALKPPAFEIGLIAAGHAFGRHRNFAIGVACSFGFGALARELSLRRETAGPALVFTLAPTILAVVALFAIWIPARRATRIDPITALRCE